MDALDRLAVPAADLLARVDGTLAEAGAPTEHAVWPLLRRVGALPGDAVRAVTALRPGPADAAEPALRQLAQAYGDAQVTASHPVSWTGAGADAFAAHRSALVAHLAQGEESLSGRLAATAGYADALAGWVAQTRLELARALAAVLGSTQAVTLVAGPVDAPVSARAVPAADIAVRVLAAVSGAYDLAEELWREWAPRLAELPWQPVAYAGPAATPSGVRLGG
jgi:hypothetical protein